MLTVDVAPSEDPVIEKVLNEQTSSRPLQQTHEKSGGSAAPTSTEASRIDWVSVRPRRQGALG